VRNTHHAQGVCLVEVLPAPSVRVPETPPGHLPLHTTHSGGFRLREEPAEKASGAAMAAIGQKGLPVIVWNIRLYAGITLHWL
jgi:hypothetical protein